MKLEHEIESTGSLPDKWGEKVVSVGTSEVVQSTIDKVLERVDSLAQKLGIAATAIWGFTVKAKLVAAQRDLAKSICLLLLPVLFFGWSIHVAVMKIPHDIHFSRSYETAYKAAPCDQVAMINGKQAILHEQCNVPDSNIPQSVREEGDISNVGWAFILSAVLLTLAGLMFSASAVEGIINAIAAKHTAEYDAYQDLIYDWKD